MVYVDDIIKEKKTFNKTVIYFPGMMLLFLMFFLPAAYQEIKLILLTVIFTQIILVTIITQRVNFHPIIFLFFLFYLSMGSAYAVYGALRGNMGTIPITKEIVFYTFVYMFLIIGIRHLYCIKLVHITLVASTILLCFYLIATILNGIGFLPDWMYINLYENTSGSQDFGLAVLSIRGSIGFSLSSLPSLMFLQPYLITYLIIAGNRMSISLLVLVLASTFIMLISGERAIQIIGLAAPLMIGTFFCFFRKSLIKRVYFFIFYFILAGLLFSFSLYKLGFNLHLMIDYTIEAFSSNSNMENTRITQFNALLNGWLNHPFIGAGSGAVLWGFPRSPESPWNYELSYMKLLFDFGLIGFLLYAIGIIYTWYLSLRIYLKKEIIGKYALPASVGSVWFFLGNATNPYLLKFDYLATLFIPVAIINLWFINRRRVVQ